MYLPVVAGFYVRIKGPIVSWLKILFTKLNKFNDFTPPDCYFMLNGIIPVLFFGSAGFSAACRFGVCRGEVVVAALCLSIADFCMRHVQFLDS